MKTSKMLITLIAFCLTLAGAIWAMEDRYISNQEAATSLQLFDQKIQYEIKDLRKEILIRDLERATQNYYKLKSLARKNPNDIELREELEEALSSRNQLREALK